MFVVIWSHVLPGLGMIGLGSCGQNYLRVWVGMKVREGLGCNGIWEEIWEGGTGPSQWQAPSCDCGVCLQCLQVPCRSSCHQSSVYCSCYLQIPGGQPTPNPPDPRPSYPLTHALPYKRLTHPVRPCPYPQKFHNSILALFAPDPWVYV